MPDELWARIVYDFALAYRMRRLSRTHVLGALTPLYLGWVASYTQEVGGVTAQEAARALNNWPECLKSRSLILFRAGDGRNE